MRSAIVACAAIALVAGGAHAQSRKLTVEEAVRIAQTTHPRLVGANATREAADLQSRSTRGRFLPSVHLSEEYQHWDSPFNVSFTIPATATTPAMTFPPLLARKQDTNSFVASADQPLSGLFYYYQQYRSQQAQADAAGARQRAVEDGLIAQVRAGFLRYFESVALEEIAHASEGELNEQVVVAEARVKAGVLTNADLLRVQVAAANAKLQAITAHAQADIARAQLLAAIGLSPDDPIELVEPAELLAAARQPLPAFGSAAAEAEHARPELRAARRRADAADRTGTAAWIALLPQVDAEGAYVRTDGQVFAPTDAAYVGVRASWAIWEWGATWYQARAARQQAIVQRQAVEEERRDVSVEVMTSLAQARASAAAVDVAQQSVASAEEAWRVMNALVRAGTATTTDLLDAQAALTQARLNFTRSQYQQAQARVELTRVLGRSSLGEPPPGIRPD